MAGGPGNPVGLIRVYIHFGKLKEAGTLALNEVRRCIYEVSFRTNFTAIRAVVIDKPQLLIIWSYRIRVWKGARLGPSITLSNEAYVIFLWGDGD